MFRNYLQFDCSLVHSFSLSELFSTLEQFADVSSSNRRELSIFINTCSKAKLQ